VKRLFPTKRAAKLGMILLVLSMGVFVSHYFVFLWFISLGAGLIIFCVDGFFLLREPSPSLSCDVPEIMSRHVASTITLSLTNNSRRGTQGQLRTLFDEGVLVLQSVYSFFMDPHEKENFLVAVEPYQRGTQELRAVVLRWGSPLQLWQREVTHQTRLEFLVIPNVQSLLPDRGLLTAKLAQIGVKPLRSKGAGMEFDSLRRYVPGDSFRSIDWSASSKWGRLMTRTYQVEKNHEILLGIDCGRLMGTRLEGGTKLDHVIDSCLGITSFALRQQDSVGAFLFGSKPIAYLPPKKDKAQLRRMAHLLASAQAERQETQFLRAATALSARRSKRMMIILFTDFLSRESSLNMLSGLFHLSRRHCILFVAVADPFIKQAIEAPVLSPEVPFQKAVAFGLQHSRYEMFEVLQKSGMFPLDLTPEKLVTPVLMRYLELKASGRF
jgi:uncharacterized protein (DUF58 family)